MNKKYILLLLFLTFLIPLNTKAKEIDAFACNYDIKCKDPYDKNTYDLGIFQVRYDDYNDGDYKKGEPSIFYKKNNNEKSENITDYISKKYTNYKNYGFGKDGNKRGLYILYADKMGQNTAYFFSQTNECPKMWCSVGFDGYVYITPGAIAADVDQTDDYNWASVELSASTTLLKAKGSDKWQTKEDFYNEPGVDAPKEPLVCSYNLTPMGQNYEVGIKADSEDEKVNIKLTTNYNPNTGDVLSYRIDANDSNEVVDLNENVQMRFKGKTGSTIYFLRIDKKQLKKIYKDSCIDEENLYLYLSKNSDAGEYNYVLTTDESDVYTNIIDIDREGRKKYYTDFKPSELDFNEPLTCAKVLGKTLSKIVKTGITILQIVAAIIAIVKGMLLVVPAVVAKDADALRKASKQLVILGVLLALIIAFRPIIRLIGFLFDYDVSCIL